jgi:hypothetical protein
MFLINIIIDDVVFKQGLLPNQDDELKLWQDIDQSLLPEVILVFWSAFFFLPVGVMVMMSMVK